MSGGVGRRKHKSDINLEREVKVETEVKKEIEKEVMEEEVVVVETEVEMELEVQTEVEVEMELEVQTEVEVETEVELDLQIENKVKLELEVVNQVEEIETQIEDEVKVEVNPEVVDKVKEVKPKVGYKLETEVEKEMKEDVVEEAVKLKADITYKCISCHKFYSSLLSLDKHRKLECGKEPSQLCHLCTYITKQPSNLTRHLALKHNLIPDNQAISHAFESRICYKCGGTFKTKNSLDDHLRYTCGQKATRICPHCDYKGVTPSQLNAHLKRMHKITPVKKARSYADSKIVKMQSFHVLGGYKCPRCEKVVKCVYSLQRHLITVCGRIESEFCSFCNYKNTDKSNLRRHMSLKHQFHKKKLGRPKKIWVKEIVDLSNQ